MATTLSVTTAEDATGVRVPQAARPTESTITGMARRIHTIIDGM